ncbi:hypothetical protein BDN72DRAFT_864643 [Pluteus cervinus]|uniref:Uncharacterized protein n=1 Tax=Pluteus cervinus TaxID=181527 RepID=A0ACD3A466_9AGAR|nr:hypothetical protein BDN72DRAFT_864643 [Pluteus cervinus]
MDNSSPGMLSRNSALSYRGERPPTPAELPVRQRWNVSAKIPVECLTEIFICARDQSPQGTQSDTVIKLSRVCHVWRDITLNRPELWNVIDVRVPRWISECLARSKALPLMITLFRVGLASIEISTLLRSHLYRVTSLAFAPQLPQKVLVALPSPETLWSSAAPSLESLNLSHFDLPNDLFQHGRPTLLHLALERCKLPWSSPILSRSLEYLSIRDPHDPLTISRLFNILSGLPALEELILIDVISTTTSTAVGYQGTIPRRRVSCRFLDSIRITERSPELLGLIFSGLHLPNVPFIRTETGSAVGCSRLVHTILASAHTFRIESFCLIAHPDSCHIILKSVACLRTITISWDRPDCQLQISKLYEDISLHRLSTLELDYVCPGSQLWSEWKVIAGSLPFLVRVVLGNGAAIDFFSSLPLRLSGFTRVVHWVFRMQEEMHGVKQPRRSQTDVGKLSAMFKSNKHRTVEFAGGWWALSPELKLTLEAAKWTVVEL